MKSLHRIIAAVILLLSVASVSAASGAPAKTFVVTVVTDTADANPGNGKCADSNGNCSLRAAVMETNALAGEDSINLPEDTFKLTRSGPVDSTAFQGDLDITGNLTITGAGEGKTIIDGLGLNERLFEIHAGAVVSITHLTSRNAKEFTDTNDQGGGIRNEGTLTISSSRVTNNRTTSSGGGIYNAENATLNLINSQVDNNYAPAGGGIHNAENAVLTLDSSVVYGNSGTFGGGISNTKDAQVLISYSAIYDNGALVSGGIDNINGFISLKHSTVSDNSAVEAGGGISNAGGNTIFTNSTISGNSACQTAGGINMASGYLESYNVTITNNLASTAAVNEGCLNFGHPTTWTGGGINLLGGQVDLYNTIIADNIHYNQDGSTAADDCSGKLATLRHSLLGTSAGCIFTNEGSIVDQNAKLGALDDNGGHTQTHALLEGSPAIDAGSPNGCKDQGGKAIITDQRGFPRPFDGDGDGSKRCDMGAYELVNFSWFNYLPFLGR